MDWCFTSTNWISTYPNTLLLLLSRPTSHHIPYIAQISTYIPKAQVFRFENYWIDQPGFIELVQGVWNPEVRATNSATRLIAKFKLLQRVLKRWGKSLSKIKNTIKESNHVLLILDTLEERRPLQPQEANFRVILKRHILKLLKCHKDYWKKRYTIRWTKFGDEGTNFFHAAATEPYRINTITSLDTTAGTTGTTHHEKASLLWEEYKDRIGQTENPTMLFNQQELLQRHDLSHLSQPFTKEDIDDVVKHMPIDKAPGPDGFNGLFIKKCWQIIKRDVYDLCSDFFENRVDLTSINNSFITLVPKINNPSTVNDFKPIALINCIIKIIPKLLGNRLQSSNIPLVHKNQYGFIKTRTIQDCLAWAFEYIHQCQHTE